MAEDDDGEAFGEFASADTYQPDSQSKRGATADNDDDDEWGDFVKSPQQSQPADLSFSGNRVTSPPPWVRPSGALPLSIFGDGDEEEKEVDKETFGIFGDFSPTLAPKDASEFRDLGIMDLYDGYPQIKTDIESCPNSSGGSDPVESRSYSSSSRNAGASAVSELKNVDFNHPMDKSNGNEFNLKPYVSSGPNENGHSFWMQEFTGFGSDLKATSQSVQEPSSRLDTNGQGQLMDFAATAINDASDNEWEFKDAFSDFGTQEVNNKVDPVAHEISERKEYSYGAKNSSNKPLDLFGTSNGSLNLFATSTEFSEYAATSSGISSPFQEVVSIGIQPAGLTSTTNLFFDENDNHNMGDDEEFDEDFGDFTAAPAENGLKPGEISSNGVLYPNGVVSTSNSEIQVDLVAHEVSERSTYSSWNGGSPIETSTPSDNAVISDGIPSTIQEVDFFAVQLSMATGDGFTSVTKSIIKQDNVRDLLKHNSDVGDGEFGEDFGEFTTASAESGPKPEAFPFIFGDEQPATDLLNPQSTSYQRSSHTLAGIISVNDLISNLYSQPEQTSSVNTFQEPAKTHLSISDTLFSSTVVNQDDSLADSSWILEDASQQRVDIENKDASSELKLNNYVDFYFRLREELCFVAKSHFERVKLCAMDAQNDAAVSGENSKASTLDKFQLVWKELEQMNIDGENSHQDHHPGGNIHRFVQVLLEPQFQILDSEYQLSEKLLLVEKDLRSAVELLQHTTMMIKILTIRKIDEQLAYISTWTEMISACLQELKHGALIWSQAKKKNVQDQLLTELEGKKFFRAIGEIYRVVVVLEASAKLFKPWMLSSSVDSQGIYILLEESHAVWRTSGLEEVISTISALDDTSLLESIKHILNLDDIKLQNYLFTENESRCWLSMLTEKVVPGMKMVAWENEQCFVTLANLWANLISLNPPKLLLECLG